MSSKKEILQSPGPSIKKFVKFAELIDSLSRYKKKLIENHRVESAKKL